jgi:hypothetical protein
MPVVRRPLGPTPRRICTPVTASLQDRIGTQWRAGGARRSSSRAAGRPCSASSLASPPTLTLRGERYVWPASGFRFNPHSRDRRATWLRPMRSPSDGKFNRIQFLTTLAFDSHSLGLPSASALLALVFPDRRSRFSCSRTATFAPLRPGSGCGPAEEA